MALTPISLDLPGRLFRCAMPFSGYDRSGRGLLAMRAEGVSVVVVLTEPDETLLHAGRDLGQLYRAEGFQVVHFPIRDLGVAADAVMRRLVDEVLDHLRAGRHVAVHCLAGKGRTGTLLACLGRAALGLSSEEAIVWVRRHIPGAVESMAQMALIARFDTVRGDDLPERPGH